jgi:hypothetical protein
MKKLLLYLTTVFFIILFTVPVDAQLDRSTAKVGTTAGQFLKIGAGGRAIGMGGAYTAVGTDIYSVYYNPAGISHSYDNVQVTFNHAQWLADISYDFAAASLNIPTVGVMFVSLTSLGVPEEKVRTFEFPEGDGRFWDAKSLSIGVGFSRRLTENFSIGMQAKFIREGIWNSSASGFALDVGTYYVTPFNNLVIGASILNFGSKMKMDGRDIMFNHDPDNNQDTGPNNILSKYETGEFDLPLTFRIGLGMDVYKSRYFRTTVAVDAAHPNDNTEYVNSGIELAYNEMFFVRAGYKSLFMRDSEEGLTLGGGISYAFENQFTVVLNYGWADFGRLKNIQFFDLGLRF